MSGPSLERILFGHVRHASAGAGSGHPGLLASADRGTVFLDEIGEMPTSVQRKLLRALDERRVLPVGASAERTIDA
jgi:transcriptional regulator with PAS, ATPase and Fis domain